MRIQYVHLVISIFAFAVIPNGEAHASPKCESLFSKPAGEQMARLTYLEMISGVPHEDRLLPDEQEAMLGLVASQSLSTDALYDRYDRLSRYLRNDLAFVVNKNELIKLSSTSLVAKVTIESVETSIGELLKGIGANVGETKLRRLQIPHTVILQLTEAKFRLGLSDDKITDVYNGNLAKIRRRPQAAANASPLAPTYEAASQTIQALEQKAD